ncbi:Glutathione s-transferase [Thalictrum thalictroides]|uniref:glutathione transferase n=1 Tax=Thalictrum thalictroides TaxID=46969 RepID=A0A7J6VC54_THATH|nr:Glutathione s-transferase [Thalictrum thalictroides]
MSTCTVRVLACLYEKGLDFQLVPVNMAVGEHKNPAYLAKNPFGQIPALEDGDDLTLFESRAITRYIATKYKEQGTDLLRMDDSKESALVNVWLEVEAHQFGPAIYAIVYQRMVIPVFFGGVPDEEIIETNSEKLGKVLDVYEEKLSNTNYLAGDFFSLADLHHLPYTYYLMKTPEAKLIESRSHVKAWWDDISSRPAFLKVAEGMKAEIASEKLSEN